jgi:hypothetical protein
MTLNTAYLPTRKGANVLYLSNLDYFSKNLCNRPTLHLLDHFGFALLFVIFSGLYLRSTFNSFQVT